MERFVSVAVASDYSFGNLLVASCPESTLMLGKTSDDVGRENPRDSSTSRLLRDYEVCKCCYCCIPRYKISHAIPRIPIQNGKNNYLR